MSAHIPKPWPFKAIEFLTYAQVGSSLVVISSAIFLLIDYKLRNLMDLPTGIPMSVFILLIDNQFKGSRHFVLSMAQLFFLQLIISSVILYVLKAKDLVVIKRTAIIILFLRAAVLPFRAYLSVVFLLTSLLTAAFLFLHPVKRYVQIRTQQQNTPMGAD